MNYSELVDQYIKNSGLSLGEIAKRMQDEKGIKIDRSYISKLRNDPKYPASEEINRALAEITGGDPTALVVAAYYEKAPEEIRKTIDNAGAVRSKLLKALSKMKNQQVNFTALTSKEIAENIDNPGIFNTLSEDTLLEILDKIRTDLSEDFYEITNSLKLGYLESYYIDEASIHEMALNPSIIRDEETGALKRINTAFTTLNVQDDSMSGDRMQKGDHVYVRKQNEVQPHEIAVVKLASSDKFERPILRRVKFQGEKAILVASNPLYEPLLVDKETIKILGRVIGIGISHK